ncbi:hypothetical protein ABIF76_004669 [Bradyrhizobium ottawaense]
MSIFASLSFILYENAGGKCHFFVQAGFPTATSAEGNRHSAKGHLLCVLKNNPAAVKPVAGLRSQGPCQYIRGQSSMASYARLRDAQILCCGLAGPAVSNDVEGHLLSFIETAHAGAFNRADMNEDVLASLVWLNEAEAFLAV